ncbi:heme-binding protein 2 [Gasterosteus aculeatus]|uniref:Heme-binding protein 1 n=1 Tax=Gasterosteus aculeatus aculeatus TaxID=481459 RepID=G3P6B4_GASAC|nr:heme-binding protein 2 [Gasterosteus aculeatus aculeatus]
MFYLSGFVGLLLVLTAEARVGNSSELDFCSETDECCLFDLICRTDDYEVRHYDSVSWVSTNESSLIMEVANMRAFRRLFTYINENNVKMTTPVLLKLSDNTKFWQSGTYTMSFLLPSKHQKNPPKPTDDRVYIETIPDMKVYVRSYGGWMLKIRDQSQAEALTTDLNSVGAKYKRNFHYAVGYNSPMTMFNRHNEVWYVVEDEPVCTSSEELDS